MTKVWGGQYDWHRLWVGLRSLALGGIVGLAVFGSLYVLVSLIPDTELQRSLRAEDGPFEVVGAALFLVAGLVQLLLFWRSDVPVGARLVPFMRRNVFYLGLALVLLFAFAEEISWGQRIFGWATPDFLVEANTQQEINIHNLAGLQDSGLLNMTRLFNLFWLGFVVLVPITALVVPLFALLYRRISLPLAPLWVGGLFLGHFVSWRIYNSTDTLGRGDEIEEAFLAICWLVFGLALLVRSRRAPADPTAAVPPAAA